MTASPVRQRSRNRVVLAGLLSATCALTVGGLGAGPVLAATPAASRTWTIVHGARLAPNNVLNDLAVISKRLAWAAGIEGFSSNGTVSGRPLIERWNGRAWSRVRLPSTWPGGFGFVEASSANDAWALGQDQSGTTEHLLHWNGHAWRNRAFPGTPGTFYGNLGLTAARGGRAWLIGSSSGSSQIFGWN